jgi:hypothetical protein
MDRISSRDSPFISFVSVYDSVASLEVSGEFQQRFIFVVDVFAGNSLLDHFLAPVVIKPWLVSDFLAESCFEQ